MAKTCRNFECLPTSLSCLCHKAVAHLPNDHRQTRQGVVVLRMPPPINHHTERNRGAEKKTGISDWVSIVSKCLNQLQHMGKQGDTIGYRAPHTSKSTRACEKCRRRPALRPFALENIINSIGFHPKLSHASSWPHHIFLKKLFHNHMCHMRIFHNIFQQLMMELVLPRNQWTQRASCWRRAPEFSGTTRCH